MVGAGGIGCELLKNLVLTGFGEIHVVDLDTIDLSNLNRQFLFRHEHIKQPKAIVAKQSAAKFNPKVKIEAYHANIKDAQFTKTWFKSFDIVFNALDNMEARRYVNEMCIATDVPLVESGTTGFKGQASVVKRGITECYACREKDLPKAFPVCTIRSTPSQPIHCIVWAKSYLFTEVFGVGAGDAKELDFSADEQNKEELDDIKRETVELEKIRGAIGKDDFPHLVFDKVFKTDIETLIKSRAESDRWKGERKPIALSHSELQLQAQSLDGSTISKNDQKVWSLIENFAVFSDSLRRLTDRNQALKRNGQTATLEFDKDDEDTLDFVSATANLRSHIFGIGLRSKFDIKQMAGNIIPAIATTNAIIAGASVLQSFKIFRGDYASAKMFYTIQSTENLMRSYVEPPNLQCAVCSPARTDVVINPLKATLKDLVEALKSELGYEQSMSLLSKNNLIFEIGDEDLEEDLPKLLKNIQIGSFITVQDDDRADVVLSVEEKEEAENPVEVKKIAIPQRSATPTAEKAATNGTTATNGVNGDAHTSSNGTNERKRPATDDLPARLATKVKTANQKEDVIDVDNGGAILIE